MVVKEESNNSGGIKYRCKKCGHIFYGDAYTNQCPIDYSFDIEEYKGDIQPPEEEKSDSHKKEPTQPSKPPVTPPIDDDPWQPKWKVIKAWILKHRKALIITAVILLAIVATAFLWRSCDEKELDIFVKMEYDDSNNRLDFMVDGVSPENLKDYKINVYDEKNTIYDSISFDGRVNNIHYEDEKMIDGKWYYFYLERIDGDSIKKINWNICKVDTIRYHLIVYNDFGRFRLKGVGEGSQTDDTIDDNGNLIYFKTISCNPKPIRDKKQYEIKIEEAGSDMSEYVDLKFEVEGNEYHSNPFYVAAPNQSKDIEIKVSASNVGSPIIVNIILDPINDNLPAPITKSEAQNIINGVSSGEDASAAQSKLAAGNVNLKRSINDGNIKTLWGVLEKASDGYYFTIKSFEIDENTNKIKSGTLDVEIRK